MHGRGRGGGLRVGAPIGHNLPAETYRKTNLHWARSSIQYSKNDIRHYISHIEAYWCDHYPSHKRGIHLHQVAEGPNGPQRSDAFAVQNVQTAAVRTPSRMP
jgi:hypothetical protein